MQTRYVSSLRIQISAAFLLLLLLFAAASWYSLGSFQRQLAYDALVDVGGRLELTAQQLHAQAMNYEQNAPRDYPTYYRDIRLYYQNLMSHVGTFDEVVEGFMSGKYRGDMEGPLPWLRPSVSSEVDQSIQKLEDAWSGYRLGLFEALGSDRDEPRLEYAAEHSIANHAALEQASRALTESLRRWAADEHIKITRVSVLVIIAAVGLSLLILAVLHYTTLAPLQRTIAGFQRVAQGDFGHRVDVAGASEVRQLSIGFNQLSARLHVLFRLIERLHQGNDLDEVIGFLARDFPQLLRIDWIGVVMVSADSANARLEVSYLDGAPERVSRQLFALQGTLLEQALAQGEPMFIPEMTTTATRNPRFQFLRSLVERGLKDAIFLPLPPDTRTPIPAVLVFSTRKPGSYDEAHRRFLDNIGRLITHSFGRTVRLSEHARLAAIGEFASGIAHELRTPLATIALALDYFDRLNLIESARRRVQLARQEAGRMRRLLEEILLYAKPLSLDLKPLRPGTFLRIFVDDHGAFAEARGQRIRVEGADNDSEMVADADRLTQVMSNLTQNACEAAPQGAEILWILADDPSTGTLTMEIANPGPPIPPELLSKVTEPFFSTKQSGTGLGLAIVQRLTQALGGELTIRSNDAEGTRVRLLFPSLANTAR